MILTLEEARYLQETGRPLPQDYWPPISENVIEAIGEEGVELANYIFEAASASGTGEQMSRASFVRAREIANRYGWYETCATLAIVYGGMYRSEDLRTVVNESNGLSPWSRSLLEAFAEIGHSSDQSHEVWRAPIAALISAGHDKAVEVITCAAICVTYRAALDAQDEMRAEAEAS